jgi:hypothetical protein
MMLLPGPRTVLSAAGRARTTAGALLGVPGRVLSLRDRVEDAVDRVDGLLDSVTTTATRADVVVSLAEVVAADAASVVTRAELVAGEAAGVVTRADAVAGDASRVVDRAESVAGDAAGVVARADTVAGDAAGVVTGAGQIERTAAQLLTAYEPALRALRPTVTRLAETFDPREVEALVGLIDQLPKLLDSVDTDVMPLLGKLNDMAPDLHALLEAVDDLRSAVAGIPGIGRLMRRGDEAVEDPDTRPGDGGATRA